MIRVLILFFLLIFRLEGKVLIMTHCFNKPEFITWQYLSFKKFLKDDYEFVVFNDTPNEELFLETEEICIKLGIRSIVVPQEIHVGRDNPSEACADTIQFMMSNYGIYSRGITVVIDSDMFLIRDLSIEKYLDDYDVATYRWKLQGKTGIVTYFLPNLMFFNMNTLPHPETIDFGLGEVDGIRVDTAGLTYFYIQNNPSLKWKVTNQAYVLKENPLLDPEIIEHFKSYPKLWNLLTEHKFDHEFYNDFSFLHFRAGSNWNKMEEGKLQEKTLFIKEAMQELLN